MTESVAIFLLGFLSASLLALLAMPLVWKRAAVVAKRRTEAALPLSLDEIQADKDRLRAEFAMASRRLEMALDTERGKTTAKTQEVGRITERLREIDQARAKAEAERARTADQNTELWARCEKAEDVQAELREQVDHLTASLARTEKSLSDARNMHDGTTLKASEQKIELTAREAELAAMQQEVMQAVREKRLADQRMKDIEASRQIALGAASEEKSRAAEVDGKNTRMLGILADRDEALSRRERDVERLRSQLADANASEQKLSLEVTGLLAEKSTLETRLSTLLRENRRLRGGSESSEQIQ